MIYLILLALLLGTPSPAQDAPGADRLSESQDIAWRMAGPGGGGWIESIAWDSEKPDRLYVGCDVGGFYVSEDAGKSYQVRNNGLKDYFIESIAVHPRRSKIILLGTESGIFRTVDRGRSWQRIRKGFLPTERWSFSSPIGAVCFDPRNPRIAYAGVGRPRWDSGGQGAIYRSLDAGLTWENVSRGQLPSDALISDIEIRPSDSRVILAATNRGVFRSEDRGKTWRASSEGLPHSYTEEVAFALSAPQTVYVTLRTLARGGEKWNGGVYRSDDAGQSWRPANGAGLPMLAGKASEPSEMSSQYKEIAVDPRSADTVYAGNRDWVSAGLRKTIDGGRTWKGVFDTPGRTGKIAYGWITQWGPSMQCMTLSSARPERIAVGTSGHVFVSGDGGGRWNQRYTRMMPDGRFAGRGLEVTCLMSITPDLFRPDRLYFGFMDIGLLISEDQGESFRRSFEGMKTPGNCFIVAQDPARASVLWAATGEWTSNIGDICRSSDGGRTWKAVGHPQSGLPEGQVRCLLVDRRSPIEKRRLLATSAGSGLYESRDNGDSWHSLNGNLPPASALDPRGLLLDPKDSSHILLALGGTPEQGAGIYESRNSGKIWTQLNRDPIFANITALAADPSRLSSLYVATRETFDPATERAYPGGVFKSADGGFTWRRLLDYHFVNAVAVNPANPRIVYAATTDHPYHDSPVAEGVLKSADGGLTWKRANAGMSHRNIICLSVNPHRPSLLYAGSGGNGAFIGVDQKIRQR
ncbi:MAG: hypothetical protein IT210_12110 [Armatimonadetes bacterium]|nr:hypothetical protein [Armatimonadota bacterium]